MVSHACPTLINRVTQLLRSSPFQIQSFQTDSTENESIVTFTVVYTQDARKRGGMPSRNRRRKRREELRRHQHQPPPVDPPPSTSTPSSTVQRENNAASQIQPDSTQSEISSDDLIFLPGIGYADFNGRIREPPQPPGRSLHVPEHLHNPEPILSSARHSHREYQSNDHHTQQKDNYHHFNKLVTAKFKNLEDDITQLQQEKKKYMKIIGDLQAAVKKKFSPVFKHYCGYCQCLVSNPHLCPIKEKFIFMDWHLLQVCEGATEKSMNIVSWYANKLQMRNEQDQIKHRFMTDYNHEQALKNHEQALKKEHEQALKIEQIYLLPNSLPQAITTPIFITDLKRREAAGCTSVKDILLAWYRVPSLRHPYENTYQIEIRYPGDSWSLVRSTQNDSCVIRLNNIYPALYQPTIPHSEEEPINKEEEDLKHLQTMLDESNKQAKFWVDKNREMQKEPFNKFRSESLIKQECERNVENSDHHFGIAREYQEKITKLKEKVKEKVDEQGNMEFRITVENIHGKSQPTSVFFKSFLTKLNDERQQLYNQTRREWEKENNKKVEQGRLATQRNRLGCVQKDSRYEFY